jgi:single-strand DNA-binding protein
MNSINLTGNICNDLEVKSTQSGKSVLTFNLAVKRPFTRDTTDFVPVVVWEQGAEYLGKYGRKGSRVAVSGKLTTRKFQDKDGNNRTAFEVVADTVELMDVKSDAQGTETASPNTYTPEAVSMPQGAKFEPIDASDDLPF